MRVTGRGRAPDDRGRRRGGRSLWLGCVVGALLAGACGQADSPTGPSPDGPVVYGVVGASDALGIGSSVPCIIFALECPGGTGYAYVVQRRLQADGLTVELANRGIPGAVISGAFQSLARDSGTDVLATFLDQIAPFVPSNATHVSIFAGGNDANVVGRAVRAGLAGSDIRGFVDRQVQQFGADFEELVNRIRSRAPNARIVAMNLPNLAAAPYLASAPAIERSVMQRIAVGMADRINAMAGRNVIVIDLLCDARVYQPGHYSSDGFHPNDQGYELIADLLYPALRHGSAPPPSSACPQRSVVPAL